MSLFSKSFFPLATLIFLMSANAVADYPPIPGVDGLVPEPADCRFFKDPSGRNTDPFEPGTRMVLPSDLKSHCIDTRRRRSIEILHEGASVWTVANFWHNNKFWVAQIPVKPGNIKEVRFVEEVFPAVVPAAHTFVIFKINPENPVILTPQLNYDPKSVDPSTQVRLSDFISTIEAVAQPGFSYDIFKGEVGEFNIAYRMTSIEDRAVWMTQLQHHEGQQYRLDFTSAQADTLLKDEMLKSASMGLKHRYETIQRNCTNEQIRLFDNVLSFDILTLWRSTVIVRETLPTLSISALRKRRLIGPGDQNKLIPFSQDPDVKESLTTQDPDQLQYAVPEKK